MNASQSPTSSSSSPTTQDSNKLGSAADKLPTPPKSPSATKRPPRNLVAELASDTGFPETDFFCRINEEGSRRSARVKKPIVKMASETVSPPPKPTKNKRPARTNPPKRPRAAASRTPAAEASYTNTCRDKAPEEVEDGPSSANTSDAATEQATKACVSDSSHLDIPGLPTTLCDNCNDKCLDCVRRTMSAINLLKSPDGRNTWYIGRYGMFEIGPVRFPQTRRSVTYVRGRMSAETWATRADAEAAGVELDSETEDEDDEAVRAEFDADMGHKNTVAAGEGLYSAMGPEDDETVDEEGDEDGEELEELEEVDLEEFIKEWREFCSLAQMKGWGPWLNGFARPAHIDRKEWNERSRRNADAANARHEARIAANRAKNLL